MIPDFRGLGTLIIFLLVVAAVSVPLAMWKVIEGVIWLFRHVTFV